MNIVHCFVTDEGRENTQPYIGKFVLAYCQTETNPSGETDFRDAEGALSLNSKATKPYQSPRHVNELEFALES